MLITEDIMTNIEYMGCEYVEPCDYIFDVPIGKYYLILITHTPAVFWVDGKITEYPGKCGIMFHPHQKVLTARYLSTTKNS